MKKFKTHFRRCHLCGELIHQESEIIKTCPHCHQHLSHFHFFDEEAAMGIADPYEKIFAPHSQKSHFLLACYPPVFGIAAYWDDH